jgi:hypothetical protein
MDSGIMASGRASSVVLLELAPGCLETRDARKVRLVDFRGDMVRTVRLMS